MKDTMWRPDIETIDRDDLAGLTMERLQMTLNRAMDKVGFYRERFLELGFEPGDLKSSADLARLPFTTKSDLIDYSPYGLLAVPLRDVVRFHTSAGALGRTCIAAYTRADLAAWRELMARAMTMAGVTAQDIVQVAYAYGLATGGTAFELGAEAIGASLVPAGLAATDTQLDLMTGFRSTALAAAPSFARRIMDRIEERGLDPSRLDVKIGLFGAEPWSEALRRKLDSFFGMKSHDVYGLVEVIGPGVAAECGERSGLHLAEDQFYPEIIDPESGQVLEPGQEGELVLTSLWRWAQPVIRYRTGDRTRLVLDPCPCGRTLARIDRIFHRTDEIIVFRGQTVLPAEVGRALDEFEELRPMYEIDVVGRETAEELVLRVEAQTAFLAGHDIAHQSLIHDVVQKLFKTSGVMFRVILEPPGGLGDGPPRVLRRTED